MSPAWGRGGGGERNPGSAPWGGVGLPQGPAQEPGRLAAASREENPVATGTWGFRDISKRSGRGEPPVLFPRRSGPPGSQSLNTAGVYELVAFLWDGSVQRRVLPALRGRALKSKGRRPAVPVEIRVPTGNPAGDRLYQPRTSQVAMLRRYTVRGERHLPPFLDARTHTHISRALPSPRGSFMVS